MGVDLPAGTLLQFIEGDFQSAWDALAGTSGPRSRGNFMFARQAMTLLEFACRLAQSDPTGGAITDLSRDLADRDPRYFTRLPGDCWSPGNPPEFVLPSRGPDPGRQLIAALFDLVRNGQAHQYQQIRARLSDGNDFQFSVTGADEGLLLGQVLTGGRPRDHLQRRKDGSDIWIKVRTDVLFLDIRDSIRGANILARGLTLRYLERPRSGPGGRYYQFSGADLDAALIAGGH